MAKTIEQMFEEKQKGIKGFQKGHKAWNKGLTKEMDIRVKKCSEKRIGIKLSDETKRKQSEIRKGRHFPKLSLAKKGLPAWNKGLLGWTNKGSFKEGKNHWNWQNGISQKGYTNEWTRKLKNIIREENCYTCQICEDYGNYCHHIDYDKKNCDIDNLIILCSKCHAKVNFNREYWIDFFQREMFFRKLPELYLLKII